MSGASNAIALLPGCGSAAQPAARLSAPIIDGQPAPELQEVVVIDHRDGSDRCSGTLISRTQVLTARHCVFTRSSETPAPLAADGFRVGLGPDDARLRLRYVEHVRWPGMNADVPLRTAIEAGEDVALLQLNEPAPCDIAPRPVDLDYQPSTTDTLALVGFGIASLDSGVNGIRRVGMGEPAGFDMQTGLLQIEGDAACFGDSGGPVLLRRTDATQALVGVLSEVGGSSQDDFCDVGTSFAATVANANVRAFLRDAVDPAAGGSQCPSLDAGPSLDATPQDASPPRANAAHADASTIAPAVTHDASTTEMPATPTSHGCSLSRHRSHSSGLLVAAALILLGWARRRKLP